MPGLDAQPGQERTAQHALREGKAVARNLRAAIRGGRKKPFVFSALGQLAAIGRRTGVANIMGITFSGFIAWWLWRTIYLSKLPRFEKKVRVGLDWTLDVLFSKDLVQFVTVRAPHISRAEEEESREAQFAANRERERSLSSVNKAASLPANAAPGVPNNDAPPVPDNAPPSATTSNEAAPLDANSKESQ